MQLAGCRRLLDGAPERGRRGRLALLLFGVARLVAARLAHLPDTLPTYNPRLEGYEVNVGERQLKGAPKYSKHESWDWSDRARDKQVYDYYGVGAYWA